MQHARRVLLQQGDQVGRLRLAAQHADGFAVFHDVRNNDDFRMRTRTLLTRLRQRRKIESAQSSAKRDQFRIGQLLAADADHQMIEQRLIHGRHTGEGRGADPLQRLQGLTGVKTRQHRDAAAVEHRAVEHAGIGEDMEKRQHAQNPVFSRIKSNG